MHLYKTKQGILVRQDQNYFLLNEDWDTLVNQRYLHAHLEESIGKATPFKEDIDVFLTHHLVAPIGKQEVWAAGVTYLRSRDARMEESKESGGADFYQLVYEADRPEIFFKATPHRVVGHGHRVNIRRDSTWNVPEPELTLFINAYGEIQGYTVGNDMSSRSIEGENPLYLPQAKVYDKSCAIGPGLYVPAAPISSETTISIVIRRGAKEMYAASIQLNRMKRTLPELADYLYRGCSFPHGCYLMTGTGLVPGSDFTLQKNDEVSITIEGIGTLVNTVSEL